MRTNRDLNGLNWQENADGSWYAETPHYKCVVLPKLPEEMEATSVFKRYDHDAILYRWSEEEGVWIQVDRAIFGAVGPQDAMLSAERLLGNELRKIEEAKDPQKVAEKRFYNDLMMQHMMQNRPPFTK